jgi:hypothetical protein
MDSSEYLVSGTNENACNACRPIEQEPTADLKLKQRVHNTLIKNLWSSRNLYRWRKVMRCTLSAFRKQEKSETEARKAKAKANMLGRHTRLAEKDQRKKGDLGINRAQVRVYKSEDPCELFEKDS